jgi:hypothetical protein
MIMTKEEAKIIVLEDALRQAQSTVEFMHGCLTYPYENHPDGGYYYAYPEHTLKHLEEWKNLAPRGKNASTQCTNQIANVVRKVM